MTGRELWAQYQSYTRDVTENGRKLGFAAAAICWFFKDPGRVAFPIFILWSLGLLVIYFGCDVLHPFWASLRVKRFTETEEERLYKATQSIEGDIEKPRWVDKPAFVLYCLKVIFLLGSFAMLIAEFIRRIF